MRTTIQDILKMQRDGTPIPMVTAYDFPSAQIADRTGIPLLLVGDSLGMVVHGHSSTIPVSLDDMARHSAAVVRGSSRAMVIADLPFLSYTTVDQAVASAGRLMREAGVQAVKLEGGATVVPMVRRLVELGIPVMGHLGFTPQSVHQLGIRVQGKQAESARQLLADALALQAAGAFAMVLELVPAPLAEAISGRLSIPTIGIGAGVGCDGQVLVWHDLLGLFAERSPRHAKRYAETGEAIEAALTAFAADVRARAFPTAAQSSTMDSDELGQALRAPEVGDTKPR